LPVPVLINGEPGHCLDPLDRGVAYGDGLFETIAVGNASPLLWDYHMQRLGEGAMRLAIPLPDPELLHREAMQLIDAQPHGVLKIQITRGIAQQRGYAPPATPSPTRIHQFHPASAAYPLEPLKPVKLRLCSTPLGISPALAGIKHLNRLEQVLARAEWRDPQIFEGLMADPRGYIVEGTMSNLFLVDGERLITPRLLNSGVAGIMRRVVIESARDLGLALSEADVEREQLFSADALFITNSLIGIRPAESLDGFAFAPAKIDKKLIETAHKRAFDAKEPGGMFQ
jgi:4-amino-4-deoxychorismate lyase